MANNEDLHGVESQQHVVGTGMSAYVTVSQEGRLINNTFKYVSGGTLWVVGTTQQAQAVANGLTSVGYLVGTSEVLSFNGPAKFFLYALSATTVVHSLKGFSQGYGE